MTDHARAIEAGARASDTIWNELCRRCAAHDDISLVKRLVMVGKDDLESAIASGALVPASAVADMRERCAKVTDEFAARLRADAALARKAGCDISDAGGTLDHYADLYEGMSAAIRQLDTAPACGDYVVVRRSDLTRVVEVARRNEWVPEIERVAVQINAASRTGGGSK